MRYRIAILDETDNWCDDVVEKAGKVFGVYIYTPDERTFCCELTPSYALYPLPSITEKYLENDRDWETLCDDIMEGDSQTDQVRYYHTYVINSLPRMNRGQLRAGTYHYGVYRKSDEVDDIIENYRCNSDY